MGHKEYTDSNIDFNIENTNKEQGIEQRIEHFNQSGLRDTCHYMCSSLNYTNIIILILVILLIYHFVTSQMKSNTTM
jgi:hypothetical protein